MAGRVTEPGVLLVSISAVTNACNFDRQFAVINRVDHSVIADTNASFAIPALQLLAAGRRGFAARLRMRTTICAIIWDDSFFSSRSVLELKTTR
jgi:hypothetical protein